MYQQEIADRIKQYPWATMKQIAAMVHCEPLAVSRNIKKLGLEYQPKTRFRECPDLELFQSLRDSGCGIRKIAKNMNSTYRRVSTWSKYYNIPTKTYFWIRKAYIPKDELWHLYNKEELTLQQIGDVYGLTLFNIRNYMIEYGLDRNEPSTNFHVRDKLKDMVEYNVEPEIGQVADGALWLSDDESLDQFF